MRPALCVVVLLLLTLFGCVDGQAKCQDLYYVLGTGGYTAVSCNEGQTPELTDHNGQTIVKCYCVAPTTP